MGFSRVLRVDIAALAQNVTEKRPAWLEGAGYCRRLFGCLRGGVGRGKEGCGAVGGYDLVALCCLIAKLRQKWLPAE